MGKVRLKWFITISAPDTLFKASALQEVAVSPANGRIFAFHSAQTSGPGPCSLLLRIAKPLIGLRGFELFISSSPICQIEKWRFMLYNPLPEQAVSQSLLVIASDSRRGGRSAAISLFSMPYEIASVVPARLA